MPLETSVSSIADLNPLNPSEGDLAQDGDNHIRLIKSALKLSFPNITTAMNATSAELNKLAGLATSQAELGHLVGVTSAIQTQINSLIPVGLITEFAGASAPSSGWLMCQGQAVSRTTFAALFAVIGTTYGVGNGTTTFNVPDLRGVSPRGLDAGRGLDSGRALGSYQADSLLTHTHTGTTTTNGAHNHGGLTSWRDLQGNAYTIAETWNASGSADGIFQKFSGFTGSATPQNTDNSFAGRLYINASHDHTISTDGAHNHTFTTSAPSGSVSSENRVKTIALNYIIKT